MSSADTKKIKTDEGVRYQSIDGKLYKTRSGAWKHNKKLRDRGLLEEEETLEPTPLQEEREEKENPPSAENEDDLPNWRKHNFDDPDPDQQVIPFQLKALKRSDPNKKRSKSEVEAERKMAIATLSILYRGGDYVLTKYGKIITEDTNYLLTHSDQDYTWISEVTNEALEENGIYLAAIASPTMIATVANGYWFGKPLVDINSKRKRKFFRGGRLKNFFSKFKLRRRKVGRSNEESVE